MLQLKVSIFVPEVEYIPGMTLQDDTLVAFDIFIWKHRFKTILVQSFTGHKSSEDNWKKAFK